MEDLQNEIWVPIQGYEGLYEISNKSRVRSLDRVATRSDGRICNFRGKILKPGFTLEGYPRVSIMKNSIQKSFLVHRLVAIHFIPNPNNFEIVEHKDDNPANCSIDNLMWSTLSANSRNCHYRSVRKQIKAVLQFDLDDNLISEYESVADAARAMNLKSYSCIAACCNGLVKTSANFKWKYKD